MSGPTYINPKGSSYGCWPECIGDPLQGWTQLAPHVWRRADGLLIEWRKPPTRFDFWTADFDRRIA